MQQLEYNGESFKFIFPPLLVIYIDRNFIAKLLYFWCFHVTTLEDL